MCPASFTPQGPPRPGGAAPSSDRCFTEGLFLFSFYCNESILQTGSSVSFREPDLIPGPTDTCLGRTVVQKATEIRPPAGLRAQISMVYSSVNFFFFLPSSDNKKLQIITSLS